MGWKKYEDGSVFYWKGDRRGERVLPVVIEYMDGEWRVESGYLDGCLSTTILTTASDTVLILSMNGTRKKERKSISGS